MKTHRRKVAMKTTEQEMLKLFKVEELEKRYEMGKWRVSASVSYNPQSGTTYTASISNTF